MFLRTNSELINYVVNSLVCLVGSATRVYTVLQVQQAKLTGMPTKRHDGLLYLRECSLKPPIQASFAWRVIELLLFIICPILKGALGKYNELI